MRSLAGTRVRKNLERSKISFPVGAGKDSKWYSHMKRVRVPYGEWFAFIHVSVLLEAFPPISALTEVDMIFVKSARLLEA